MHNRLPLLFVCWRRTPTILIHGLLWSVLCQVVAFAKYSELQQQGHSVSLAQLAMEWGLAAPGFMALSLLLQWIYQRKPDYATQASAIALGFLLLVVIYLPLEIIYCAWLDMLATRSAISADSLWRYVVAIHRFRWFNELSLIMVIYLASIALSIWQQNSRHRRAWQQSETENLQLQLALERQRLASLRAQLEPHFIFNALSAISALVRRNDTPIAIGGINRLSNLLRYALDASNRDWVSFDEELRFIEDYVALQRLR
jgi:two-component system sensor histidine kinase AlgZ